ncbi:MAG TPA: O-antigen ligase family protein [Blastocatellia bacterium]|nr:O-antigen ligase family protein [Blastocatellia bacterium]
MKTETTSDSPVPHSQRISRIAESVVLFALAVYALFAPHSIAVTQGAYLLGMLAWAVQLAATRRFNLPRTPADIAIFGFFACCVVSSFLSYVPLVSIKGLRSPAFFLAFYFVFNKVPSLRFARLLAFTIVFSCLVNVGYSANQIAVGRGLRIDSITQDSPFSRRDFRIGDVIIEVDRQPVESINDLLRIVDAQRGPVMIKYQRGEIAYETTLSRRAIKRAMREGLDQLGITTSPGRSFRVSGFYSHYETYAEVLQLIAALAVGLLIAQRNKTSARAIFLWASVALITGTILMTSTRAAISGLALAVIVMAIASSRRRAIVAAVVGLLIFIPLGMLALERSRGLSMFDPSDGSTAYRLKVWGEALTLVKAHPLVGIGKGSEGKLKDLLGLYDNGRLPPGHFHSTIIQIATWWGLPALAFYAAFMMIFLRSFWHLAEIARKEEESDIWGIALGGIGALVAFNVSSLVHFNFGDGEVVMTFWFITGLVFAARRLKLESVDSSRREHTPAPPSEEGSQKSQLRPQESASESSFRAAGARRSS